MGFLRYLALEALVLREYAKEVPRNTEVAERFRKAFTHVAATPEQFATMTIGPN